MGANIIFFVLAFVAIVSSFMAVTSQKIIRSAVYLLFVLLSTAGFYFLLDYHFLAITQIAVYAGGVMVLFIFSIVLTNHPGANVKFEKPKRMLVAAVAALAGLAICGHIVYYNVNRVYSYISQDELKMEDIGMGLLGTDKYQNMLPFEAVSLLLLACIIGGLMIARKR
jgi:NADH-quinone oxidoreductase subunit J